jgi:hypothetical protein
MQKNNKKGKNINPPRNQNKNLSCSHSEKKVEESPDYLDVTVESAFRSTSPTRDNLK